MTGFSITLRRHLTDSIRTMANEETNSYLRDSVLTATPEQLQLMLYDGAIRFSHQGRDAIERKDYEASFEKLTRAQHIVQEMQSGLRHEVNPQLCERVASIYNFVYRKLVDASTGRDVGAIDDAVRILRIERDTWQILVDKVAKTRETPEGGTRDGATREDADQGNAVSFSAEV